MSTSDATRADKAWPTFQGGKGLRAAGLGVGVLGLAATAGRAFMGADGAKVAIHAYLVAYAYWLGLALAALILLCIWHAAKAKWVVAIRRPVEIIASTMPLFVVLFIPIVACMKLIYPWAADPDQLAKMTHEEQHLIHFRAGWINPQMFMIRAGIYLAIWFFASYKLTSLSFKQDRTGDPKLTESMWKWGPAMLPFVGVSLAFAAFDWLMSIETMWFSSMWGVYYFAGSFVALFALLLLTLRSLSKDPSFAGAMRVTHWLSTGQFLLAFTAFWGYITFDQYMLTFVANLPDATPYLIHRQTGEWLWVAILIALGHFVVPFLLLLSRPRKLKPNRIAPVAAWILFIHYVDVFWIVMPQVNTSAMPDWSNFAAFFGVGGLAVFVALFRWSGQYSIPVKDPFLAESLDYKMVTAGTHYLTDPTVDN
jgi:hypothetical protein